MRYLFALTYILFTTDTVLASNRLGCEPYLGLEVTDGPFASSEFDRYTVFRLDKGNVGTVYRLKPRNPAKRTARIIKDLHQARDLEGELDAFAIMTDLLDGLPIRVARCRAYGPNRLELEDLYGETVKKVTRLLKATDPNRVALERKFRDLREEVRERLGSRFGHQADFEMGGLNFVWAYLTNDQGRLVCVALKPDNILIESGTGEWILIDPN